MNPATKQKMFDLIRNRVVRYAEQYEINAEVMRAMRKARNEQEFMAAVARITHDDVWFSVRRAAVLKFTGELLPKELA
jgi:hypothetical protein